MASTAKSMPQRQPLLLGKGRRRAADLAAYAGLILVGAVMALPFVWMVGTSLKTLEEVYGWPPKLFPALPQWGNYVRAWNYSESTPFGRLFFNSTTIALTVTFGRVLTCAAAGYAFARMRFPGRDKLFLFYVALLIVPFQVTLVPLYLLITKLGWMNTHNAVIVPHLTSVYGTFLARQFMVTLPRELEDAARVDGASPPVILTRVILPLCGPLLSALAIINFSWSWNLFLWPVIVLSRTELRTLPVGLAFFTAVPEHFGYVEYNCLMAAAVFSMLPTLIVFLLGQQYFIKGIALSGLKG